MWPNRAFKHMQNTDDLIFKRKLKFTVITLGFVYLAVSSKDRADRAYSEIDFERAHGNQKG